MDLNKIGKSSVITVPSHIQIDDAAKIMRSNHIGDLIVVEEKEGAKIPVGIITDRDIVLATIALGIPTENLSVGDIMSTNLITSNKNESLLHIINLMKDNGVKRIPLIGENKELTGIITTEDVSRLLSIELSALSQITNSQHNQELKRRRNLT